jgi:hypothetical protein
MKVFAQKIWSEPAAFIGLCVTLGLLAVALITHQAIDAGVIIGILAPLGSALGIRQFVTPATQGAAMSTPSTTPVESAPDPVPTPEATTQVSPYDTAGPADNA